MAAPPRPVPSCPVPRRAGRGAPGSLLRRGGAGTDPVSSCDAPGSLSGASPCFFFFFLPLSPARPPPAHRAGPRSRARVSGPTGCWQSGGGGGGEGGAAAGGAGSLGRAGRGGGGLWHLTALPGGGGGGRGHWPWAPASCRVCPPTPVRALAPVS